MLNTFFIYSTLVSVLTELFLLIIFVMALFYPTDSVIVCLILCILYGAAKCNNKSMAMYMVTEFSLKSLLGFGICWMLLEFTMFS